MAIMSLIDPFNATIAYRHRGWQEATVHALDCSPSLSLAQSIKDGFERNMSANEFDVLRRTLHAVDHHRNQWIRVTLAPDRVDSSRREIGVEAARSHQR